MTKVIKVDKNTNRQQLDFAITKLSKRKKMDLTKYFGKINFGIDGLEYQLKIRDGRR
jgi:hypothetical protein